MWGWKYSAAPCPIKLWNKQGTLPFLKKCKNVILKNDPGLPPPVFFRIFFYSALTPLCDYFFFFFFNFISFLSSGLWLWRHPLSTERVGEHHHCAAAPCAGKRGPCQVRLMQRSLPHRNSFIAHPDFDKYSCCKNEIYSCDRLAA